MRLLPKLRPKKRIHLGSAWPFSWGRSLRLTRFSVDVDSLATHMYVVGRSGKGKSKFLEGFLWQMINRPKGSITLQYSIRNIGFLSFPEWTITE